MTEPEVSTNTLADVQLDALLLDYEMTREDQRSFVALQWGAIGLAFTAVTLLGALVNEEYRSKAHHVPGALLAGAPMAVLCLLAYLQSAGSVAVLRSFYARALELEIRKRLAWTDATLAGEPRLAPMSLSEIQDSYATLARGWSFYRYMTTLVYFALWSVFGGLTVFLALRVSTPWRLVMGPVVVTNALLIFRETITINMDGRKVFRHFVDLTHQRRPFGLGILPATELKTRSLVSYLLIPRPDDLVKGVFVAAGVLLSVRHLSGGRHENWGELTLFVVSLEFLVYQARYQWNDIRGISEDGAAPSAIIRDRLPGGLASTRASIFVIGLRAYLLVIVCSMRFGRAKGWTRADAVLGLSWVVVFLLALPYESLRARGRNSRACSRYELLGLLFAVGLGYSARFLLGWYAVGGVVRSSTLLCASVAIWALGVLFVSMTWLLEGASYILVVGRERLSGSDGILSKPHLLTLMRTSGLTVTLAPHSGDRGSYPGRGLKIFAHLRAVRWQPWNVGHAVSSLLLYFALPGLLEIKSAPPLPALLIASPLVVWQAWGGHPQTQALGTTPLWRQAGVRSAALLTLVLSALWSGGVLLHSVGAQGLLLLPVGIGCLLIPTAIYASFSAQSYEGTRQFAKKMLAQPQRWARMLSEWFITGPKNLDFVGASRAGRAGGAEGDDGRGDKTTEELGLEA